MRLIFAILLPLSFLNFSCWAQQQALLKIAYVNSTRVTGLNSSTKSTIDNKLKFFAEKNSIDLILENAVSVNPDLDITEQFNSLLARNVESKFESATQDGKQLINITFINTEKLHAVLGNNTDQQKQSSVPLLNQKIREFAEQNNIQLILQKAVYTTKELDCTDYLLHFIKDGKNTSPTHRKGYISTPANTFKFVNASKILNELPSAKEASIRLAQQFRIREEHIRELQKSNSEDFFKARDAFQKDLALAKQSEFNTVVKKVNADINNYRIKNSLQIVIQDAVFITPMLDATDEILNISSKY